MAHSFQRFGALGQSITPVDTEGWSLLLGGQEAESKTVNRQYLHASTPSGLLPLPRPIP